MAGSSWVSLWARAWPMACRLYARSVCDTKVPLQLQFVALYKCYTPLPLTLAVSNYCYHEKF